MYLAVYSLKSTPFEGDIVSVTCPGASGEITVLDHHRPLVSRLKAGVMRIVDIQGKEHFLNLKGGFLEVKPENTAQCIIEERS